MATPQPKEWVTATTPGILFFAAMALLPSCTANKKPSSIETSLANIAKDVAIPAQAHKVKNPIPSGDEAIQAGRQIYLQSCALCHGADGHGNTSLGRGMYPPAMDLTSPHVQMWADADLFWIVQNGIALTGMPSWQSTIPASDTWKLAQFIHALPRLDTQQAPVTQAATSAPTPPDSGQEQAQSICVWQDPLSPGRLLHVSPVEWRGRNSGPRSYY